MIQWLRFELCNQQVVEWISTTTLPGGGEPIDLTIIKYHTIIMINKNNIIVKSVGEPQALNS